MHIAVGDLVTVADAECRRLRQHDGLPLSGTVVRLEPIAPGSSTIYAEVRGCNVWWGCNAAALVRIPESAKRWRRQ